MGINVFCFRKSLRKVFLMHLDAVAHDRRVFIFQKPSFPTATSRAACPCSLQGCLFASLGPVPVVLQMSLKCRPALMGQRKRGGQPSASQPGVSFDGGKSSFWAET
ncbi:hypothetical protein CDAR_514381 [Caerostris darwini]|uniref:Uncharacterized protein n=1 Tax=Caerostris darwini TaxID=1538125 RepID=A0AAV4UNH7_9ARAC|nr:hypothetical protein CDAR_514381 [Caerostris darwini]